MYENISCTRQLIEINNSKQRENQEKEIKERENRRYKKLGIFLWVISIAIAFLQLLK